MIRAGWAHPLCAVLSFLLAVPSGFAQAPAAAPAPAGPSAPAAPPPTTASKAPGATLNITILEGNSAVNSIPLLRSVPVIVEVRDSNDFPVEDAAVTFTLPAQGPGGNFVPGGKTFTTRSDARGQAIAQRITPAGAGKFQSRVSVTAGDRTGEILVSQSNSAGGYAGAALPPTPWYKKKLVWVAAGGAVATVVLIVLLKHHSSSTSSTVVITPGPPVFQ